MFQTNVGLWDRIVRVVIGSALIAAFFLLPQWSAAEPGAWRWALWLGLIPLASGLAGHCPAYRLMGWSTRREGGGPSHA
jgi:hypothetical protein